MLKHALCLVLCAVLFISLPGQAAAQDTEEISEIPAAYEVYVDDALVKYAGAVVLDQTVYVSLFYTASALSPGCYSIWQNGCMLVIGDGFSLTAAPGTCCLVVNGRYLYVPGNVQPLEEEDVLVPAEVLARALGASLYYEEGAVYLETGGFPLESGDSFYDPEMVDLMARVIYNESGNQSMKGQIAVGNVLLNRVSSDLFPDTLKEVIFQPGQFPGTTDKEGDTDSIIAAKLCLDGACVLENAYWFSGVGRSCWASRNKTLVATIGGHAFYG